MGRKGWPCNVRSAQWCCVYPVDDTATARISPHAGVTESDTDCLKSLQQTGLQLAYDVSGALQCGRG